MLRRVLVACLLSLSFLAIPQTAVAHDGVDRLTNRYRIAHDLPRVRTPDHLHDVARSRARQLYWRGFYHHFGWTRRVSGCAWAENIMYYIPAPSERRPGIVFRAFRDSPTHRAIMLGDWNRMGSHIYLAPNGGMYAAQLFARGC